MDIISTRKRKSNKINQLYIFYGAHFPALKTFNTFFNKTKVIHCVLAVCSVCCQWRYVVTVWTVLDFCSHFIQVSLQPHPPPSAINLSKIFKYVDAICVENYLQKQEPDWLAAEETMLKLMFLDQSCLSMNGLFDIPMFNKSQLWSQGY